MLYIKINDTKYPAEISTFPTQLGNTAIKVKSEAPLAEGFLIVDDEDNVISDKSDFIYLYAEDDDSKTYTKVAETPIPTECFASGDVPVNPIQAQISALNRRVTDITPYKATQTGYFGENEKVFYGVPNGNVTVFCDVENTVSRFEDRLIVRFAERLADTVEITVMVQ